MLGKIEGRKRRGDQRMKWHHRCNGHELEQTLADGEGQGGLVCCCPWGHRVGHAWVPGQQQQNTEKVMETGWGRLHL